MIRYLFLCLSVAATVLTVVPAESLGQDSGLASMHAWRKIGKKTCMVDHFHNGSGSGTSRQAAEAAAARDWSGFTNLEYGSSWADYRIAVSKEMTCNRTGATDFTCQVAAIPCRPY